MLLRKEPCAFLIFSILFLLLCLPGCQETTEPDDGVEEDLVQQGTKQPTEEERAGEAEEIQPAGEPENPVDYYWPWLSHGSLLLSSGEAILGPDLFESDLGFIAEFPAGAEYSGRVIWLVKGSDVFALEWVDLSFDVEYYEQNEWVSAATFDFMIENLPVEQAAEGLQEFPLDLHEEQEGFTVRIEKILLGENMEGEFSTEPIDYVALDMTMIASNNQ
ncbi:MAG: hypothetical protein SVV67_10175 [Bacillota bacterium]|nr:hypothetical protein [Bacillota bacterium]